MDSELKRLIYVSPDGAQTVIHFLEQLQGKVRLRTTDDVLAFVRLYGAPLLSRAINNERVCEVVLPENIHALCYGDAHTEHGLRVFLPGSYGVAPLKDMIESGVGPIEMLHVNGGYAITRWFLKQRLDDREMFFVQCREFVTENGKYFRRIVSMKRATSAEWSMGFIG